MKEGNGDNCRGSTLSADNADDPETTPSEDDSTQGTDTEENSLKDSIEIQCPVR